MEFDRVADAVEVVEGAEYSGPPMIIAFNAKFFTDGLDGLDAEKAVLKVIDPSKPAILQGLEQSEFTYLLMPVRLMG